MSVKPQTHKPQMTLAQHCQWCGREFGDGLRSTAVQSEFHPHHGLRLSLWATCNFRPHVSKHIGPISHKLMACLIYLWGTHALPGRV